MAVVEYVNMSNIQFIICYLHYFFIQVFSDPSCSTPADTVLTTNAKRLDYYFKCNETLTQRHYVSGLNGVASSISFGVYGMFFYIYYYFQFNNHLYLFPFLEPIVLESVSQENVTCPNTGSATIVISGGYNGIKKIIFL